MRRAEIARKFDEIVAFAEVERFIDTPVKHYSSGMYVRLAFAVAAHLESEVLFVDEVLAVGDVQFQRRCLGRMSELARTGRTVLFVSHNIGVVRSLCTRGLWLAAGRAVEYGPVGEVTNRYLQSILTNKDQTVDLTRATRWVVNPRCRITGLEINDGQPVLHGEPLRLAVTFEAAESVHGVAVGVGFATVDGIRLMTTDTDLDGSRHDYPKGTRGVLRLTIDPLQLQPGVYMLDLGVRTGDSEALDYIPACARLEILPGPRTPTAIIRTDGNGGVRQPAKECTWDLGSA
jgi:lipopolysaccharide transport system ATP-binding protein